MHLLALPLPYPFQPPPLPRLSSCTYPCTQQAESDRKRDTKPSNTLFVVNFDINRVRERDLDKYFDYYGRINRIEIKKNYAFIQVCVRVCARVCVCVCLCIMGTGLRKQRVFGCGELGHEVPLPCPHFLLFLLLLVLLGCTFLQFEDLKDAIKALEGTNGRQFMGRTISVEYVQVRGRKAQRGEG
jgi:RNA recognition motif-containing protein